MQSTISQSETKLKNAVQFLGKKEERYFAFGFKKIECNLKNFCFSQNKLTSKLTVTWEEGWSIKAKRQIKPHLGSVESFTVVARMLEIFMALKYNMCQDDISNSKFQKIQIKTKLSCLDSNLPLSICLVEKNANVRRYDKSNSEFEIRIGNFQYIISLEFVVRDSSSGFQYDQFASTTVSDKCNYYYTGYKLSNIDIEDILIKNGNRSLTAIPHINRNFNNKISGVATSLLPDITFIDFLRIGGQLAQILLYSFDEIKREDSQNLWIRSLSAVFDNQNIKRNESSKVSLTEVNKIELNNETWRTAIVDLEIGSIRARAKVGHILKNNRNE